MSEWDSEVFAEEEIKIETKNASNIYKVQNRVKVKVQIGELKEKDACHRLLHDLRMTQ